MAVTTKKTFPATTNNTTTTFGPIGIELNNQDDLDVYITDSSVNDGKRVLQLKQSTASTTDSNHPQVNDTTGLYFPPVASGVALKNYTISTDNNNIIFNSALPSGVTVSIERRTRDGSGDYTNFTGGSTIRSTDLNSAFDEVRLTAVEARNKAFDLQGTYDHFASGDLTLKPGKTLVFEGATDDAHETTLTVADPTADRTVTIPNQSGNVLVSGNSSIVTADIANDAVTQDKLANNSVGGDQIKDGAVDNAELGSGAVTNAKIATQTISGSKLVNNTITATQIAGGVITTTELANDAVTQDKLADNSVGGDQIISGSIDTVELGNDAVTTVKITDANVTTAKIADDAVTNAKIADDQIDSEHYVDGSIDTAHLGDLQVTTAKIANEAITTAKIGADQVTGAKIPDSVIGKEHLKDNSVGSGEIEADAVTTVKIPDNAITTAKIADTELKTLADMQSGTASKLAANATLTADIADLNQIDGMAKETTITDDDTKFPTSGAVVDYVAAQLAPVGGLEVIANDASFPNTIPDAGVVISIADAGGLVVNGSGVSTTGRTLGGSTVTINGINSQFNSSTITDGVAMMVSSTGSSNTYNYHKATLREQDILSISTDIDDFANRYRVGSSNPSSNNDAGDLFFNTSSSKLLVYNAANTSWDEAQAVGNYYINTISTFSGTGGNSASFNGSAYKFVLSNAGTYAEQHIVSINGVIQKPNSGTSQPSEGFAIDGSAIIFSNAPATGSDYFVVTIGASVNIGAPSDDTVYTNSLQNSVVTTAKINNDAVTGAKIADDSIDSEHYVDGSIDLAHMSANSVDSDQYVDGSIDTAHIAADQITGALIADDAVNAEHIGDLTANLKWTDSQKAVFGAGDDLQLYHDGTDSHVKNITGVLRINNDGTDLVISTDDNVFIRTNGTEEAVKCVANGAVELYHDGTKKLNTESWGVEVVGTLRADVLNLLDGELVKIGTGADLQVRHSSDINFIESHNGQIHINKDTTENMAKFIPDGAVELYYDNGKKFETTSVGAEISHNADSKVELKFHHGSNSSYGLITMDDSNNLILNSDANTASGSSYLGFKVDNSEKARIDHNGKLLIGHTSSRDDIWNGDGNTIEIAGTSYAGSSLAISRWANSSSCPHLLLGKSRGASVGTHAVVQDGDYIGVIGFAADDGTDLITGAAQITCSVDGTPGSNDMPGALHFWTCPDGSNSITERFKIGSDGVISCLANTRLDVLGNAKLVDSSILYIGTGNDLQLYHNATDSFITNSTGKLRIYGSGSDNILIRAKNDEEGIIVKPDGAVELYHNNIKKFETTSTGITVTGTVKESGFELDVWRVTDSFSSSDSTVTNDWDRDDTTPYTKPGTGMSESSGVFTFPSTGYWRVEFNGLSYSANDREYATGDIWVTPNSGTTWNIYSAGYSNINGVGGNNYYNTHHASLIVDVTNASTFQVKFRVRASASTSWYGGASGNYTYAVFTRLGDT